MNLAAAPMAGHLFLSLVLALLVAGAAWRARALSGSGAVAAALVGFAVFGFAGGAGAGALVLFFVTSSALSRYRKRDKERLDYEKGGERDASQVVANGGVAALCALLVPAFSGSAWPFVALLGALAEANADTWATEIGSLARRSPRLITTGKPAPPGASGAVSLPGTLAAFGGATLIATVALWRSGDGAPGVAGLIVATAGGFVGAMTDSLLGASVQAQFRCPVCGKLTERNTHCDGQPTEHARGLRWLNNDRVNALATLVGALVAGGLFSTLAAR